jgi:PAS domain S-box-containing protein
VRAIDALKWVLLRLAVPVAVGLAGFAINSLPIEIFPGVHLVFGSVAAVVVAIWLGPAAGGIAGLVGGLRTWSLWSQPFPFSACLFALEGVWVGYQTGRTKRGALIAVLSYWVLVGSWLNLAGQVFLFELPLRLAFIVQARSVINGMLTGILVELALLMWQAAARRWRTADAAPSRPSLQSLVALVLTTVISVPMLYISTRSVQDIRERTMSDLAASGARDVDAIRSEIGALLKNYERGVATAADLCSSRYGRANYDPEELSRVLSRVRKLYPEFAGMYVADASGRTVAFDPLYNESGRKLVGLDYSDRQYYRDLLATKSTVYSGVYQARGGMVGPAVAIGEPLLDSRGELTGFVLGWFDVRVFQSIASRFKDEGETQIITDAQGRLIADSSMQPGSYKELIDHADGRDFSLVAARSTGAVQYAEVTSERKSAAASALENEYLLSYTTIPVSGWKVWSRQSLRPAKARLDEFYVTHMVILIVTLFLGLALSNALARVLTKPIVDLKRSAAALALGLLSERPPRKDLVTAEYDSLFRSFHSMAERLETSWKRQGELLADATLATKELEATFDAMTDAVLITDGQDRLVRANRAYYSLTGIEADQAVGRLLTEIAHPDGDWASCDVCIARLEGRHTIAFREPQDSRIGRYLEIRVDPILSPEGKPLGAVQVLRDLTDKRRVEAEAERTSAMLKNLVDSAYDGVYATNLKGEFLWANKRAAELFGFSTESLEGESSFQSVHPDDFERVRQAFTLATGGQAQRYEARYVPSDGGVRHALITNSPVYEDGEIVAVLGVMRDMTEERQAVEQAARSDKLRALGQLASGVAHNFNNALTAVLGYTQMVLTEIKDAKLTKYLNTVETAALDAAKMVQRIQNFARQRQDEPAAPADLNRIIRDALDLTRSRWRDDARAAGISYDVIFRPGEEALVTCDQSAIREVFVNIIINALDAMPSGGRLTISSSVEGEWASITFSDSGHGMTEEVRQRIFEPFYTTKGVKGNGLGLSVTYGIIERHKGKVQVSSEPKKGSTFLIKLPITREEISPLMVEGTPDARSASVLVVDDELPIRMLLADVLRARGHKVLLAEDGLAGLRAIESARFDLVITDLSMPGADGWTLVHEVRRRWPGTRLMMVTGYGGFADLAVTGGDSSLVDMLISKPFNIAEIDYQINELLLKGRSSHQPPLQAH